MKVERSGTNIIVHGLVDTVKASDEITKEVDSYVKEHSGEAVNIDFKDTFVITSSLIGSLLAAAQRGGTTIHVKAANQELYNLLDKLNLISIFNVKKY